MKYLTITLTPEQRDNLAKLADYLEKGELRAEFDMRLFSDGDHVVDASECGAVGCAVGHGPYAGIPKFPEETWYDYWNRAFANGDPRVYCWCFASDWVWQDGTPSGVAKRIRVMLEHGLPKNYDAQMLGQALLSYLEVK